MGAIVIKIKLSIIKFGGVAWILSGLLFLALFLFLLPVPAPPLSDAALLTWLEEWRFAFAMADEFLNFAALLLIPSIVGLFRILVKVDPIKTWLGCGLIAVNIPLYIVMVIILGRLAYPVYDIELSADINKLLFTLYHGGMHAIAIIMCAAILILSFTIRKSGIGKPVAYLGFVVGIADLASSYPWIIGSTMTFIFQALSSVWFIILGVRMLSRSVEAE